VRVLYVNPAAGLGGAELILLDLLASLPKALAGVEQHLVLAAEGPLGARARALGVEVHERPMPRALAELGDSALRGQGRATKMLGLALRGAHASLATTRYTRRLARLIRDLRPSLVHSNGIKSHLLIRLAQVRDIPVSWHVHDFWSTRPLVAKALGWASRRTAVAIAISQAVAQDARTVLAGTPVEVVYNGIDLDRYMPGPADLDRLDELASLAPAPAGTVRVGLVATYARWKGHDLFLEAAARIVREHPDASIRFYLIGGPIYETQGSQFSEAELRSLAASRGVDSRVGFIPFQQDTEAIYRSLDLVVHASTQPEPFGRTIAEAMACARPVVVASAGGAAELFNEGVEALGFRPGDAGGLAQAVWGLVQDEPRRNRMAQAARRTAEERFSRERLGREVADVFRRYARK
jgi:glycosyltransferase involved in cell wall biosynthesis